ncbi:MAG: 50S ribosomal protein L3 [Elusimicrobia bacterium RIFCSPLOWO2_01_FULL_64_13]|nr:MAG: 50S ribosomal protein L3 [Elusimicrobia bacterium RIFCSPLOWO2_01_FULL_64_13]
MSETEKQPLSPRVLLGQKVGMTQIFSEAGERIPVSVIFAGSCVATDVRTKEKNGYDSVQLGAGECGKHVSKAVLGQFTKRSLQPVKWLKEFRAPGVQGWEIGRKVPVDIFSAGDYVDVSGISKGKGFAGVMKRHGFSGLPASHGASDKERSRGSSGGGSGEPQRVLKGTRMAGRMGGEWVTIQKLEVVKVDPENGLLLVRGAVPGAPEQIVVVKETTRSRKRVVIHQAAKSTKKAAIKKAVKPAKPEGKKT